MNRVMIGDVQGNPMLLVRRKTNNSSNFTFWVINGAWNGRYNNGLVYCGKELIEGEYKILSEDQEKLKGDYNNVFNRFREEC